MLNSQRTSNKAYFGNQNSTSLTRTLKVKRVKVDEHFADLIDEMPPSRSAIG